jgi:putative ABC transport system permease protein
MLYCSSALFGVLGLKTVAGRPLLPADDVPGAEQKVVLSHHLYTQRFGADPSVVGTSVTLDGHAFEVVGVLPEVWLDAELLPSLQRVPVFDLLLSLPLEDPQVTSYGSENFNVLAQLRQGVLPSQLDAELLGVAESFTEDPDSLAGGLEPGDEYLIDAVPLHDQVVGEVRTPLLVLLGATGLLLLIACVNVANLLLTRSATLSRSLAIRIALGARRRRVFAQSMLESLMLASLGGLGGLALASVGVRVLHLLAPADLPRLAEVGVDRGILLFAAMLCVGCSLLFGVAPALRSAGVASVEVLAETGPVLPARSVWRRSGSGYMVMAQVALSVMLLVGAGLLVRTFRQLQAVDPGFDAAGVLSFHLSLEGEQYDDREARVLFFEQLWEELEAQPGISRAGGVTLLPLSGFYAWTDFAVQGVTEKDDRYRVVADEQFVTPEYFDTMGMRLLAGRGFNGADGGDRPVAIVDRVFAERHWSVEGAIGKWITPLPTEERAVIVGVVDSIRHYGLAEEPRMTAFFPYRARPVRTLYGTIRGAGDARELAPLVYDVVAGLDPGVPVYDVRPVAELVRDSLSRERLLAYLLNVFGGLALILATVGLYSVLSFAVATHAHELAVRMALGARRRDLYRLVLRRARMVTFAGIGIGVVTALLLAGLLEDLLYGVGTADAPSFVAAVLIVAAIALLASYVPARRASEVDPMTALKRY